MIMLVIYKILVFIIAAMIHGIAFFVILPFKILFYIFKGLRILVTKIFDKGSGA